MKNMKWYVMQIFTNYDKKVKEAIEREVEQRGLNDLFGRIVIPKERVYQIRNGKKIKTEKNYFPGYMMIECDLTPELLRIIRHINGVVGFLGTDKPIPMKDVEIKNMLQKVDELYDSSEINFENKILIDQKVKIIDGPFESMYGVVKKINKEKNTIMIEVTIFNRITPLELAYEQVLAD
jgi:transcription termination/antitermination protein NusG